MVAKLCKKMKIISKINVTHRLKNVWVKRYKNNKTRMTTFIKTKFNKSDDQTNIDNIELLLILN